MSDNPDHNDDRWTKIGRLNDVLSVICFPLALFSALTGVGLLTYFEIIDLSGTGPAPPRAETSPEAAPASQKGPRADARIEPKAVKTVPSTTPPVAQGEDERSSTDGRGQPEKDIADRDEGGSKKGFTEGWIYAGSYPTQSYYSGPYYKGPCRFGGCPTGWTSRYLDFSENITPGDLKGKALHPLKHSNVRTNHPSLRGVAAAFGVVAPDTRLVVGDVFREDRGQEVWLKVKIYGSILPLTTANIDKRVSQ